MKSKIGLNAAIGCGLLLATLGAQRALSAEPTSATQPELLTLPAAIQLALAHNPDLRSSQARVQAAQGNARQAAAWT
ncbi:MAG TPA: TolC family protein, partial [Clostridia bacterium]|nr:TolC family protein [Clostridia bacterium]